MKIEDIKVGMMVLLEMGLQEPIQVVVLKIGKIQVRVGNEHSGSSWVYPKRITRVVVPLGINHDEALENEARRLERERIIALIDNSKTFYLADWFGVYAEPKIRKALEPK